MVDQGKRRAVKIAIVIPARYGSTRFPGKPLAKIGGRSMLSRVVDVARKVGGADIIVTTEDQRIADHAKEIGADCILTSESCPTGSDRVLEAIKKSGKAYDFVINLQGDAPFTPASVISAMIAAFRKNPSIEVITPVHQLNWDDLDRLRESKKTTPFSGTTATIDAQGRALWFSKAIIPAIRKDDRTAKFSPVFQHIGLYGFKTATLEKFCALPQSPYEKAEGLEQLRLLENGVPVHTVQVEIESGLIQSGIDSPEDLARAEKLLT